MRLDKEIKCTSCASLLQIYGVTVEDAQRRIQHDQQVEEEGQPKTAKQTPENGDEAEQQETGEIVDEEQAIRDLMRTYEPHIVLIEGNNRKGYEFGYRCKLCTTQGQPSGKVNTLVRKRLSAVRHYLSQHVCTPTHRNNLARWQAVNGNAGENVEAKQADAAVNDTKFGQQIV